MSGPEQDAEAIARLLARHADVTPPSERWREEPYTLDEVLVEMNAILSDAERHLGEDPEADDRAVREARWDAIGRDRERTVHRRFLGLGEFASTFVFWLVERADRVSVGEELAAARRAVRGDPREQKLADDLRRFIREQLDGTISDEEALRRQKKPRAPLDKPARRARPQRRQGPRDWLTPREAEARLRETIPGPQNPAGVWEAFKRFAALPVAPEPPERLGDELLLFEWGMFGPTLRADLAAPTFLVDLVRQFSILDEDGDPDRLEQLHCTLMFDPLDELTALGGEPIWSDGDRDAWIIEVERSPGFHALRRPARRLEIGLDRRD